MSDSTTIPTAAAVAVADRVATIHADAAEARRLFEALAPAWNALVATPVGARLAYRLFGYHFPGAESARGAHAVAGTSIRGTAAAVGAAELAAVDRILLEDESRQIAKLEELAGVPQGSVG